MPKDLLMLYGAAYAVVRFMNNGSKAYSRKTESGKWVSVDWVDIFEYLTDLIDNYKEESEVEECIVKSYTSMSDVKVVRDLTAREREE